MQTVNGKRVHPTNIVRHKMTRTEEKRYQCRHCGKCFSTSGNVNRHIRNVHKEKPTKFANLGKGLSGISGQQRDEEQRKGKVKRKRYGASTNCDAQRTGTRTTKQSFVCRGCGKRCRDSHDLKLQCTLCNKCFSSRCGVVRRTVTHGGEKRFDCVHCHKWFPRNYELERHSRTHTGEKPFKCEHCDKWFSDLSNRRRHEKTHGNGMPLINNQKPKRRSIVKGDFSATRGFPCEHCRKRFPSQCRLKRHTRTHTGEHCGKLFSDSGHLRRHERTHSERISVKSNLHDNMRVSGAGNQEEKMRRGKGKVTGSFSKKRRFQCGHCGKRFSWQSNLKRHTRTHTGEKPFMCERCGKLFSDSGNLRRHEKTHSERISVTSNLHDNMRASGAGKQEEKMRRGKGNVTGSFSKKRSFQCGHCGKRFSWQSNLKRHTRTHTGEKPFTCEHCGKRFSLPWNLRRHEKTHTVGSSKNNQHNTRVDRAGSQHKEIRKRDKRHNRTHTGEKPFKCQYCDKWFSTSGNRKRHEHIHSRGTLVENQEPRRLTHACWICAEEFRSEVILRKHYDEHMSELCDVEQ